MHCRTVAVEELYFGAVQLEKPIYALNGKREREEIKLGIVMIAPENSGEDEMETISFLSKMLIERPSFIKVLREGTKDEATGHVSKMLEEFYHLKNKKIMED